MKHYDRNTLFEFVAGESSAACATEIQFHLANCPQCAAGAEECRALRQALQLSPEYSAHFTDRVMSQLRATPRSIRDSLTAVFRAWFVPALQFACAVTLLTLHYIGDAGPDLESFLLSGTHGETATEDLRPQVSDLGIALGISLEQRDAQGS